MTFRCSAAGAAAVPRAVLAAVLALGTAAQPLAAPSAAAGRGVPQTRPVPAAPPALATPGAAAASAATGAAGAAAVAQAEAAAGCTPPAAPAAFQGLAWGACPSQIQQRFGAPACADSSLECTVAPYPVAGVPFKLTLQLSGDDRSLVRVLLSHEAGADSRATAAALETGWGERHRVLRRLLTQRYGGPEATHVDSEAAAVTASARWRRGDTLIELNSTYVPRAAGQAAREITEVRYQPVSAGEAGKL